MTGCLPFDFSGQDEFVAFTGKAGGQGAVELAESQKNGPDELVLPIIALYLGRGYLRLFGRQVRIDHPDRRTDQVRPLLLDQVGRQIDQHLAGIVIPVHDVGDEKPPDQPAQKGGGGLQEELGIELLDPVFPDKRRAGIDIVKFLSSAGWCQGPVGDLAVDGQFHLRLEGIAVIPKSGQGPHNFFQQDFEPRFIQILDQSIGNTFGRYLGLGDIQNDRTAGEGHNVGIAVRQVQPGLRQPAAVGVIHGGVLFSFRDRFEQRHSFIGPVGIIGDLENGRDFAESNEAGRDFRLVQSLRVQARFEMFQKVAINIHFSSHLQIAGDNYRAWNNYI